MSMINLPFVHKPTGYSMFAHEIVPVPRSWAAKTCNLVFFKHHEAGGHFAVSRNSIRLPKTWYQFLTISRLWSNRWHCLRMWKVSQRWLGNLRQKLRLMMTSAKRCICADWSVRQPLPIRIEVGYLGIS